MYIIHLDFNHKKLCNKKIYKEYNITKILSKRGWMKVENDEIYLYKLGEDESYQQSKLFITKNNWRKMKFPELSIPFENHILKINVTEYNFYDNLKFIIEKVNDKIYDYYFKTNKINKEIISFLLNLK